MQTTETEHISEYVHGFVKVVTFQIQRCLGHLSLEVAQGKAPGKVDSQKSLNDIVDVMSAMDRALNTSDFWKENRHVDEVKLLAQRAESLNLISRAYGSYEEDYAHHLSHFIYRCRSAGIDVN